MKIFATARNEAVTVNGTTTGNITVASDAGFYVGAICYLSNNTPLNQRCVITDLPGSNVIGVRFLDEENRGNVATRPQYGKNSCAAFTVASGAKISMEAQWVNVDPNYTRPAAMI